MKIRCAYGSGGKTIELPDNLDITIIEPEFTQAAAPPEELISNALSNPIGTTSLENAVKGGGRIGVVVNDITRATPYPLLLPALFTHLEALGADRTKITIFNATGTHRANTPDELRTMLSAAIVDAYPIVQNNSDDEPSHRHIGTTPAGNEISILRDFLDCEVKILTGFIEPHFFAGFSGGGKAIMPGLAALRPVLYNHSPRFLDHPNATWGICDGNPLWEDLRAGALLAKPTFLLNVALNRDKEITAVFAGDLDAAHQKGREYVKARAMQPVEAPFDIVVTTNSGYPLDLNLYQAVKGMSAAVRITKPGGDIVLMSECRDGVPEHGMYGRLLKEGNSVEEILNTVSAPGFHVQDVWQVFIHAKILKEANVHIYTDGLTEEDIRSAKLLPCTDVAGTVEGLVEKHGKGARICILPEGPQTIPYLA